MRDLLELRDEIDQIDSQIVDLYERRMAISEEVAEYKIAVGKKVFDKQREVSKLETLSRKGTTPFLKHGIRELFEQIMSMSRKRQYQLLTEHHVDTWRDAMEAIQNGEADYAVFPIENSSAGIVSENYDLMVEYNNYIVGEQIIRIDHALLGLPEADMDDITDIYSHPQALMQCSKYLESHRDWEKHSLKNTAMSAQKIKEDGKKNKAAIASTLTADIYGLKVLDEAIQNNKNNYTKFIIVANKKIFELRANKISISFEVPHESGSLYHKLSHFIYNGINMNKIESRPVQGKAWEYRFFVDIEGNLNDAAVQNALRGLTEETIRLKILGNYVSAEGNE